MNCERAATFIGALMDGELDLRQRHDVEAHLEGCEACTASLKRMQKLSDALHSHPLSYEPGAALQDRVLRAVRQEAAAVKPRLKPRPVYLMWAAAAACALLMIALTFAILQNRPAARDSELIASDVLSSHVRSLMGSHLLDVPSTDQHTVKPWFDGKLDFSPNVKDFPSQGFRLIGGRLDFIAGRPVAALIFQHNQHMVNLFTWPAQESDSNPVAGRQLNGYQSLHWSHAGMNYWAVADIPVSSLQELASLYLK